MNSRTLIVSAMRHLLTEYGLAVRARLPRAETPRERISAIHGQPRTLDGVTVIPMYHPAAALRNGSLRAVMMQDFARINELLKAAS